MLPSAACIEQELILSAACIAQDLVLGNLGEPAYMYNPWNYLDMVVLSVGYINLFGDPDGPLKVPTLTQCRP